MAQEHLIVTGLHETLAGLKKFDKDNLKKFNAVINKELRQAKQAAQALAIEYAVSDGAPLSNMKGKPALIGPLRKNQKRPFPTWNTIEVVQGIKTSKAQGKVKKGDYTTSAGALLNASPAGHIFELAGRGKRRVSTDPRSIAFKKNLHDRFGETSRLIYRIVDRDRIKIEMAFYYALEQAKIDLQKALESQKS
jgi:hypothetical protein